MTRRAIKKSSILVCVLMLSLCIQGCSAEAMQIIQQILPIVSQVIGSVGGSMSQTGASQSQLPTYGGQLSSGSKPSGVLTDQKTDLGVKDVKRQDSPSSFIAVDKASKNEKPASKSDTKTVDLEG